MTCTDTPQRTLFADVRRMDVPFALEFADPDIYARTLASTGPAYETIQNVGEAEINVVAYLARNP
jgi:hypothetical protein